jgi:hypothetical protein
MIEAIVTALIALAVLLVVYSFPAQLFGARALAERMRGIAGGCALLLVGTIILLNAGPPIDNAGCLLGGVALLIVLSVCAFAALRVRTWLGGRSVAAPRIQVQRPFQQRAGDALRDALNRFQEADRE